MERGFFYGRDLIKGLIPYLPSKKVLLYVADMILFPILFRIVK